jgi:hypothetical protein
MHFETAEVPFAKHWAKVMSPVVSSQGDTLEIIIWCGHFIAQSFTVFIAYTDPIGGQGFATSFSIWQGVQRSGPPSSSMNMHPSFSVKHPSRES